MEKQVLIDTINNAINKVKDYEKNTIDSFYHGMDVFKEICSMISGKADRDIIYKVQELQKEIYMYEPQNMKEFREAALINSLMHIPFMTFDNVAKVYNKVNHDMEIMETDHTKKDVIKKHELIDIINQAIMEVKSLLDNMIENLDDDIMVLYDKGMIIFKTICSMISGKADRDVIMKVQELQREIYHYEPPNIKDYREAALINSLMNLHFMTFDNIDEVYNKKVPKRV